MVCRPLRSRGAIGRVLHQRVFEDVSYIRRLAAAVDQLGSHELIECDLQGRTRETVERFPQLRGWGTAR